MNLATKFKLRRQAGFLQASTVWLLLCLGIGGALIGKGLSHSPASERALSTSSCHLVSTGAQWRHEGIENVHVGQRVVTPQTARGVVMDTAVDPATWKLLNLVIDIPAKDGAPVDMAEIQTLQPPAWIEETHAAVGIFVPTPMDLQEMGMEQGAARVVSIERCPPIKEGPGRVVLTTVNHLNQFLFDLTVVDALGRREVIGVTGWHKIYSESRDDWVSVSTVTTGESLRGHDGTIAVESLARRPGTFRVYNMTVEGEHAYYVSNDNVLGHNIDCNWIVPTVTKAVNSDIAHAAERAVERGVFSDKNAAADALRELTKKITQHGLPPGTLPDPRRADSVLVPIANGKAVYEITKKGTAILRTVLGN